jgi:hypothetical protein
MEKQRIIWMSETRAVVISPRGRRDEVEAEVINRAEEKEMTVHDCLAPEQDAPEVLGFRP